MKTSNKYIVLAAMALAFAACTHEEDFTPQMDSDAVKINATIGAMQTRVAYEDDGATNFINGDEICVQNILRENKNIATYTFDGTTWATIDALVWNGGTAESQFQAWYPATASFDEFTLPTDQNSIEELPAADWMTASTSAMVKPADKTINLAFEHKLAKITVQVTEFATQFGDDPYLTAATIYSLSDEYVTVNGGIKPVLGGNAATAIVCPGKYTPGSNLMEVTIFDDGRQINLNVPVNAFLTDTGLEAGKHYTFSLKVGKDVISITKVNVEPWATKEIDGGVAEEIPFLTFSAEEEQTFMVVDRTYSIEVSLQYSVNNGAWADYVFTTAEPFAIAFGGKNGNLRLRGKNIAGTGTDDSNSISFSFGNPNVMVSCNGDIRTLVDWEAYTTVSTAEAQFVCLFRDCTVLTSAPELPATTLAEDCYHWMFLGCTSLTDAPVLPATTLSYGCYSCMFEGCTSLTQAPELPATVLAEACYELMFEDCTSLTQAPELPATILMPYCYSNMFIGCSSLTTSPVLPAPTLVERCYNGMFKECTLLNHITMLATDISADRCLSGWVDGVASTGTFTKAASLEQGTESGQIPTSKSGIPSGWTVKNYGE